VNPRIVVRDSEPITDTSRSPARATMRAEVETPRGVLGTGEAEDLLGDIAAADHDALRAQLLGHAQRAQNPVAFAFRQLQERGCFHVENGPLRVERGGQPPRSAHQVLPFGPRPERNHEPLGHGPRRPDSLFVAVVAHLRVHAVRRPAQGQLAQRDEVALAKEVLRGPLGLLGQVDLALGQPAEELVGRQVHEFHLVGAIEHLVRQRLENAHPRYLADDVVQAFEVLDIERREDVDAGVAQFLDVLPALGMARPRRVGVRELIDQQEAGMARERRIEIEFLDAHAIAIEPQARQEF
jgi:hypothetical protein